jgi:hypothetical protein
VTAASDQEVNRLELLASTKRICAPPSRPPKKMTQAFLTNQGFREALRATPRDTRNLLVSPVESDSRLLAIWTSFENATERCCSNVSHVHHAPVRCSIRCRFEIGRDGGVSGARFAPAPHRPAPTKQESSAQMIECDPSPLLSPSSLTISDRPRRHIKRNRRESARRVHERASHAPQLARHLPQGSTTPSEHLERNDRGVRHSPCCLET